MFKSLDVVEEQQMYPSSTTIIVNFDRSANDWDSL